MRTPFLMHFRTALWLFLLCGVGVLHAQDVNVVGLFPGKALLSIDGDNPHTVAVGSSLNGVKVIAVDKNGATLQIAGHPQYVPMGGQHAAIQSGESPTNKTITLSADERGHFQVQGMVNGGQMRFLVDTGASVIALNTNDAKRLRVNLKGAQVVYVNTANGTTPGYRLTLREVNIEGLVLYNVDAVVQDGMTQGMALLGMSFLNRMEMRRDGSTMTLTKRY